MSVFDESRDAYKHNGDEDKLRSLGLRTTNFGRAWTDLGTVTVEEAEPDGDFGPRPAATVRVEVMALPSMGWRFTIVRPREEVEDLGGGAWRAVYEPCETIVFETGSGGFVGFWPTAELMATHMIEIKQAG